MKDFVFSRGPEGFSVDPRAKGRPYYVVSGDPRPSGVGGMECGSQLALLSARRREIGGVGDLAVFAELLDDADLIIDATIEEGIHHALAQYAADAGKHLVLVAATNGGYGGAIARLSDHGCWQSRIREG